MRIIIGALSKTVSSFMYIALLLLLFIFISCVFPEAGNKWRTKNDAGPKMHYFQRHSHFGTILDHFGTVCFPFRDHFFVPGIEKMKKKLFHLFFVAIENEIKHEAEKNEKLIFYLLRLKLLNDCYEAECGSPSHLQYPDYCP